MKRLGSSDSLGALMPICPSSTDEHNNNQGNNPMYARPEYHQAMIDGFDEEQCLDQDSCQLAGSEKKRRLSVDQVKALEKNFEVENKLEPERKVKLAHELGLQPRQVAVWFQNRRARWKTKQLERDYGLLKASYDGLKLNFEKLQHDNEALLKQIRELKSKINEEDEDNNNSDSKQSEKEDEFMSDSEEKSKLQTPIIPKPDKGSGSENLNTDTNGAALISGPDPSGFGDFKDGSSDSDNSSAILNEDNINNNRHNSISPRQHQFLEIGDDLNDGDKMSNFQFQEPNRAFSAGKNIVGDAAHHHNHHHQQPFVKIEEHNFFGEESCSTFFSDDQPPSLHWYEWS